MSDLRPVLERLRDRIPGPPGGLERLITYRERRRRRRRIGTIGVALILGLAGALVAVRAFAPHDRPRPAGLVAHGAIAFVRGTTLAGASIPDAEIYLIEEDGSRLRKLTDAAAEGKVAAEPAWSPDGTRIAFVLSTSEHLGAYAGDGDICVMNTDGTGLIKLTDGLRDAHPAWSPDGDRIAFVRDQGNSLVVMNADGSGATEIRLHGKAFPPYQWPAWSPDGTRIAFQASPSQGVDTNSVYLANVDGTQTTRITHGGSDGTPAWSPDGTTLAYAGSGGIYLHDLQTGTNHRLTTCGKLENCGFDYQPSWAPDSSGIVFARQDYGGGSVQIFVVNIDGTGLEQLTSGPQWNAEPIWQPVPIEGGSPSPSPSASMPPLTIPTVSDVALPDGLGATRVAIGEGAVWALASTGRAGTSVVVRIDPATDQVLATTPLGAEPVYVAAGGGAVWVGSPRSSTIERVDSATNEVTGQIQLPGDGVGAIAADEQAVWVEVIQDRSDQGQQNLASLVRIDPQTNEVLATIPLDGLSGYKDAIAIGAGSVWVAGVNYSGNAERGSGLIRIDPATNTIVATIPGPGFSVRAGPDAVWVTSPADGVNDSLHKPESWVARQIDPTTNEVSAPIPLPGNVSGVLAVTAEGVWFSGYDDQGLVLDPIRLQDGAFDASVPPIDSMYTDVAFDDASGTIWVAAVSGLERIDTR